MTTKISEARYHEANDGYEGFCTACRRFTTDSAEPDAEQYECLACGERTVYGAEQALLLGYIEIGEDGDE